jgi:hypothetical protein
MNKNFLLVICSVCVILSAIFYWLKIYAPAYDYALLMTGNVVLAILSVVSYQLVQRSMRVRAAAFVNGVAGATFLKLGVCLAGVVIMVLVKKEQLHKGSVFVLLGLYIVYTVAEKWALTKASKQAVVK